MPASGARGPRLQTGIDLLYGGGRSARTRSRSGSHSAPARAPHDRSACLSAPDRSTLSRLRCRCRRCIDSSDERARRRSLCGTSTTDIGVGGIVDGRDLAVPDADGLVDDLDHGGEAVGRAGGCRQQPMAGGIVESCVDADDDVQRALVLDRRRDDDPLHAALEIDLQLLPASGTFRCTRARCRSRGRPRHVPGRGGGGKAHARAVDRLPPLPPSASNEACQRP